MFNLCCVFQLLEKGLRFTMRSGKHTLGYGVITEVMDDIIIQDLLDRKSDEKKEKKKAYKAKRKAQGLL